LSSISLPSLPDEILIVEHQQSNRLLLEGQLQVFGLSPDILSSADDVLEALMEKRYKLIFLDMDMPSMNSIETTQLIRQAESQLKWPRSRIIGYTENQSYELQPQCIEAGMDAVYAKAGTLHILSEVFKLRVKYIYAS